MDRTRTALTESAHSLLRNSMKLRHDCAITACINCFQLFVRQANRRSRYLTMVKSLKAVDLNFLKKQHINVFRIPEELLKLMVRHEEEVPGLVEHVEKSNPPDRMVDSDGNLVPTCLKCGIEFDMLEKDKQRVHFRSDWHRYNVKRSVEHPNLPPITDQQFQDMLEGETNGTS